MEIEFAAGGADVVPPVEPLPQPPSNTAAMTVVRTVTIIRVRRMSTSTFRADLSAQVDGGSFRQSTLGQLPGIRRTAALHQ
jgi:hypothetical protein